MCPDDQAIEIESTENITESVPELDNESIVSGSIDNVSKNLSANVDISILENSTRSVTIIGKHVYIIENFKVHKEIRANRD